MFHIKCLKTLMFIEERQIIIYIKRILAGNFFLNTINNMYVLKIVNLYFYTYNSLFYLDNDIYFILF